jgi:hypothetical protein
MTTGTRNGKIVKLSMYEKSRMLAVSERGKSGNLFVASGSRPNYGYEVIMNGIHAIECCCDAYGQCCHKIAAEWYVEAQRREIAHNVFDVCNIA